MTKECAKINIHDSQISRKLHTDVRSYMTIRKDNPEVSVRNENNLLKISPKTNFHVLMWGKIKLSTYVNEACKVSLFEVVKNACFIQVSQVGHILCLFKFRRVHLLSVILIDFTFLEKKSKTLESERSRHHEYYSKPCMYAYNKINTRRLPFCSCDRQKKHTDQVQTYLPIVCFNNTDISLQAFHFGSLETLFRIRNPDPFLAVKGFALF